MRACAKKKHSKLFFKKTIDNTGGVWYYAHVIRNRQKKCGKKITKKLYKNSKKGLTTSKDYGIIYIEEGISWNRRLLPPPPPTHPASRGPCMRACAMCVFVNTKKIPPKKLKKYKKIRSYYFFLYYSSFFLFVYFFLIVYHKKFLLFIFFIIRFVFFVC